MAQAEETTLIAIMPLSVLITQIRSPFWTWLAMRDAASSSAAATE